MTYTEGQYVWIDGRTPAVVLCDGRGATVLVKAGRTPAAIQRERLAAQDAYLARGEQPTPANAHYYGGLKAGGAIRKRR